MGYNNMLNVSKDIEILLAITWLPEDRGNISRISGRHCAGQLNYTNKTSNLSSHSINYVGYINKVDVPNL